MKILLVLILYVISVHGKIANFSDISENIIEDETNKNKEIHIELPVIENVNSIISFSNDKLSNKTIYCDLLNLIHFENKTSCNPTVEDNEVALILTPYIEEGRMEEARIASQVDSEIFLGFKSHSGFLTVNETYNSNVFFWYFPVENKRVNETPWIIWLQGGPGVSSMTGLFEEIGPVTVNSDNVLEKNPFTWLRNHSLVFIDNPVGTGFSFTNHRDGYVKDINTCGKHLYEALTQFLQVFPELRSAPLYLAGESYAGKYVPAFGFEIHKHKESENVDINFQGLMLGNPYVDPATIQQVYRSFYSFGMIDQEQLDMTRPLYDAMQQDIAAKRSAEASTKWGSLLLLILKLSYQNYAYNFLKDELGIGSFIQFLEKADLKKAIHVGDIEFNFLNITVRDEMAPDFLTSTKPFLETLLNHYRVLAYCGQLDQMVWCTASGEIYRTLRWNGAKDFKKAPRLPYIYHKRLAGYHKTGGSLTEVMFRGAGHMVPVDAPDVIQALISEWTHQQSLNHLIRIPEVYKETFIQNYIKNITSANI